MQCVSTTYVMGQQIRCDQKQGHYRYGTKTIGHASSGSRHSWYSNDDLDTEVTWEDPL